MTASTRTERDVRRWARHRMTWSTAGAVTCLAMAALMTGLLDVATPAFVVAFVLHVAMALAGAVACLLTLTANRSLAHRPQDVRPLSRLGVVAVAMPVAWLVAVTTAAVLTGAHVGSVALVASSVPMAWIPMELARTSRRAPRAA